MNTQVFLKIPGTADTAVTLNWGSSEYHDALVKSYQEITDNSIIAETILKMPGMSGVYYRAFINNLIRNIKTPRYLEIGSWAGSTACSVISNNKCKVTCIDNWSQFGGPKQQFISNVNAHLTEYVEFNFIESDFREVNYSELPRNNVYLFDGPHTEQDQYDGIKITQPCLEDIYIQIVDDWNWSSVRNGTFRAIKDLGLTIMESIEILTNSDGQHATPCRENSRWHNGYWIAVIKK